MLRQFSNISKYSINRLIVKRLNSTSRPISDILQDVQRNFDTKPETLNKIEALKKLTPESKDITKFIPSTVTIGIVQSKDIKAGLLLNSLITDPLSDDNKCVQLLNQYRSANPNSNIKVTYGDSNKYLSGGRFLTKSPLLSSDLRLIQDAKSGDGSSKFLNRDIFNNLAFVEINDPTFSRSEKTEGAEELILNTKQKDDEIKESDCQNIVYVKSETSAVDKINDFPYFEILNHLETHVDAGTLLKENLKSNTFSIDLQKLEQGNKLISESIQNVSAYLRLYKESNMNELLYTINRETSGYKPLILLLRSLIRDLENCEAVADIKNQAKLKDEIHNWSQKAHFELQSKVTPFLENVLVKELSKFSQLVYNSGDLTLVISNLLNGTRAKVRTGMFKDPIECYGSLEKSISEFHYLEGRIDVMIPTKTIRESQVDNFIEELKFKVSNQKIPELQSSINSLLIKEIIAAPFTVFAICNIGYIYDFITLNTAFALTALTAAFTANTTQKKFIKSINEFTNWYLEQLRLYIENTSTSLGEQLQSNILDFENRNAKKTELLNELRVCLSEIENADELLRDIK